MSEAPRSSSGSATALNIPAERMPRHIAMIMDGNGRWAQRQNKPRVEGHLQGVHTVREITEECTRLGLDQLTLYCLSSENWKRPQQELEFLMSMLLKYLIDERQMLMDNNIRLRVIGSREKISREIQDEMDQSIRLCENNSGTCLCLAINYGGRQEIVAAVREIARRAKKGEVSTEQIDEHLFASHLYTAGMRDPDLLIRTAGEMRISNYLLWQISYSEIWVTDRCWPEFGIPQLHEAIIDFASRERRFGGLNN